MFFSCKKSVQKTVPNANVLTLRLLYTTADRIGSTVHKGSSLKQLQLLH